MKAEIFPTTDKSTVPLHIEKLLDSSLETSIEQFAENKPNVLEEKNDSNDINLKLPEDVNEVLTN